MSKPVSKSKSELPRLRVGDRVRLLYGWRGVMGEVIEVRGKLGARGDRIYTVRMEMEPEMISEFSERSLEKEGRGNSDWLTGDKSSGRISVKDVSGKVHVYRKCREVSHRYNWDAAWRGGNLEPGYGSLKPQMKPAEVPQTILVGDDSVGRWEEEWLWSEYERE